MAHETGAVTIEPTQQATCDLDPTDWDDFRRQAHALLDSMLAESQDIRQRPVWRPTPSTLVEQFEEPIPRQARDLASVLNEMTTHIAPYATGNRHPRFMGWVHGAGTPYGMLAEMVSGALNMNCGGRNHIGIVVERQIVRWMAEVLGYPASSSGLFVTGSSMANLLAVVIAKVEGLGPETRRQGLLGHGCRLVAYCSDEAHGCVAQAMEMTGLGSANLRRISTTSSGALDVELLAEAIARDRSQGNLPFLVIGTAGTVNTGAIDPLAAIAELARREKLWFHVDGAIGALAVLSPHLRYRLAGIEASDSIAMDFHKWGHVPYDAGFLLVRHPDAHRRAFESSAAYLQRAESGLAAGGIWPCDLGPDLSRGFRALKTWVTIMALGADRIAEAICENCRLAQYMSELVQRSRWFELKASVALNIVCFGLRGADRGHLNRQIVATVQLAGTAAPSWTTINGECVIRCAIVNHRTTRSDVPAVIHSLECVAQDLLGSGWDSEVKLDDWFETRELPAGASRIGEPLTDEHAKQEMLLIAEGYERITKRLNGEGAT